MSVLGCMSSGGCPEGPVQVPGKRATMTGRKRILAALAHQEPDRVPVDFGSTWVTTIHSSGYERLKSHFGVDGPTVAVDRMQQVCLVDERVLQRLDVDTRAAYAGPPDPAGPGTG